MRSVSRNIELGIPLEGIREINRVLGASMSQLAASVERIFLTAFFEPEGDEKTIAARYGEVARITSPEFGFVLQHIFNLHLREQTRLDVLGNIESFDPLSDTREIAVCFADLVGFTSLGEQVRADELGAIAERLNEIAVGLVEPPVRLVKTIGDAVMLISSDPDTLIDVALQMVHVVDREDEGFPRLSVGIAVGEALTRGGDVYGPPVNHASRFCDVARPGSVVTSSALQQRYADRYDWTEVGHRRFKGIDKPLELFRVREKGARAREKKDARATRTR
jgi:adenylate cyclase